MLYLLDNQEYTFFVPKHDDAIIQIYGFLPNNRAKIRKIIYQQPGFPAYGITPLERLDAFCRDLRSSGLGDKSLKNLAWAEFHEG